MDYHVFIISRIKELVDRGLSTEQAVERGIRATAGTVTSAARVMVAVFAIFATLCDARHQADGRRARRRGRSSTRRSSARVLLPATMKLLGDWNWYLPRSLGWLPRLELERPRGCRPLRRSDARPAQGPPHAPLPAHRRTDGCGGAAVLLGGWIVSVVARPHPARRARARGLPRVVRLLARAEAWLARSARRRLRPSGTALGPKRRLLAARGRRARRRRRSGGSRCSCSSDTCSAVSVRSSSSRCSRPQSARSRCRSPTAGRARSFGSWKVDTLGRALLFLPAGIIVLRVRDPPAPPARSRVALARRRPSRRRRPRPAPARLRDPGRRRRGRVCGRSRSPGHRDRDLRAPDRDLGDDLSGVLLADLDDDHPRDRRRDLRVDRRRARTAGSLARFAIGRGLAIQAGVSVALAAFFVLVWALSSQRLLLAGVAAARPSRRAGRPHHRAGDPLDPQRRSRPTGSQCSRRAGRALSTSRRRSYAGSSATSTTVRRRASSRSE